MRKLHTLNILLRKFGVELQKFNSRNNALLRRKCFFDSHSIDLVIDVGANNGGFGMEMRQMGYTNRIVSFEPLKQPFIELENLTLKDSKWEIFQYALGNYDGQAEINVSQNSVSSSILKINDSHIHAQAASSQVRKEQVQVKKLDSIFDKLIEKDTKEIYLKIDTQGFESFVLEGAKRSLDKINTIQLEMSLVPLYEGQMLFSELHIMLDNLGFKLTNMESGFVNPKTGQLLQLDGIYSKKN